MPENEDLTMRLAEKIDLAVPLHGMIWSKDKVPVEDFAQLAGSSRDTKYDYSMEKVVKLINLHCTFPVIEKSKLFKLVLFCFVTGNEDMHLKNFSIINQHGKIEISPCYDLLNTTIELKKPSGRSLESILSRQWCIATFLIEYRGTVPC